MVSAVLFFGLLNVLFEFVLLCMLPVKLRLRLLGNVAWQRAVHVMFLLVNLVIHWGTLIGTMSGIFAFVCSIFTMAIAKLWFGSISEDKYKRGVLAYKVAELV
jgi:hypothetical protein